LSEFTIIGGLGKPGSLLVRGKGPTRGSIESELQSNPSVNHFSLNQRIEGQATSPNDPEFVAGLMPGMEQIDATNAWDVSRGSLSTVVGVVDTGIDPTHSDLYLNIWINQGELPPSYLDNVGTKLTDIDSDGLITFYDLNNVTRSTTAPYAITVG
jgi:subtilisin family serine protease